MRIAVRGYLNGEHVFTDFQEIGPEDGELVERIAAQHAYLTLQGEIDMIEIEWLDEPDPNQRFFRIGTNPAGMVAPVEIR